MQEKNILVISTESYMKDGNPEAFYLSISEDTEILNEQNEKIEFEQLSEMMKVKVYSRYMILESYPGQTGAEKIIVIE